MDGACLQLLDMPQARVLHAPGLISPGQSAQWMQALLQQADWKQEAIRIQGNEIPLPRLTAWHGDPGTHYGYSGIANDPSPWTPALAEIKSLVEQYAGVCFNSVLLNLYRSGSDSVAWHSDDEKDLGVDPVIASVSLGASRKFSFKNKHDKSLKRDVVLSDGDLLIMSGPTQTNWLHQVPKTTKPVAERLNLTFRIVRPSTVSIRRPIWSA